MSDISAEGDHAQIGQTLRNLSHAAFSNDWEAICNRPITSIPGSIATTFIFTTLIVGACPKRQKRS
jgi:hypothetical protein